MHPACSSPPSLVAQDAPFRVGTAAGAARARSAAAPSRCPPAPTPRSPSPSPSSTAPGPGPVLAIVVGRARHRVRLDHRGRAADPASSIRQPSAARVILVPLVNVPSFEQKIAHVNPIDGKSMNRFYPGKMDGTQTERASFLITQAGRREERSPDRSARRRPRREPAAVLVLDEDRQRRSRTRSRARWSSPSASITIIISADRPKDPAASRYLENTASHARQAVDHRGSRARRHGGTRRREGARGRQRCRVMRYLKMMDGAPATVRARRSGSSGSRRSPATSTGIFYPLGEARHLRAEGHEGRLRHRLPGQDDLRSAARPKAASCSSSGRCRR